MEDPKIGHASLITHGYTSATGSEHSQCNLCSLLNSTISSVDGNKMFLASHRVLQLCGLRTRERARFFCGDRRLRADRNFLYLYTSAAAATSYGGRGSVAYLLSYRHSP